MDASTLLSLAILAALSAGAIRLTAWMRQIGNGEDMLIVRRFIRAEPENVWSCIMEDRHVREVPGISIRRINHDEAGERVETILQDEEGWTYQTIDRVTRLEPGRQLVRHVEVIDGRAEPFGADQWETIALNPKEDGTEILLATQGRFGLGNVFWLILNLHFSARRLRQAAETA
ncbi:MAG TPA: hypothetical protein VK862_15220 [Afifellaceae bacterium]|nr:hypothetical protein [Afifellaceae bacterium]